MLKDKVTITIKSGGGGQGSLATNLDFNVGGDGGYGGNIYIKGSENVYDLKWFDDDRIYKAGRGEDGAKRRRTGSDGESVTILVPLVTEVHVRNRTPFRISKDGQTELILEGGRGGCGSITIGKHKNEIKEKDQEVELSVKGEPGKLETVTLELKLQSDVIFIGYPNAGKSSMLNLLSDAKAKVAAYAFTTLEPQIGMMEGIKLMDLPGVIEGTSEGRGLGTGFVKHTENCRLVAHFVSLENEDPMAIYKTLRTEIKNINPELATKPEIVLLTKTDEADPKMITKVSKQFEKLGLPVVCVSVIDDASIDALKVKLKQQLLLV